MSEKDGISGYTTIIPYLYQITFFGRKATWGNTATHAYLHAFASQIILRCHITTSHEKLQDFRSVDKHNYNFTFGYYDYCRCPDKSGNNFLHMFPWNNDSHNGSLLSQM